MSNFTNYILQNTIDGKIEKHVGAEMIKMLMEDKHNEAAKDIAIIGMAVKMPKADDIESFWQNLQDGVNCIRDIPEARKKDMEDLLSIEFDFTNNQTQFIKAGYMNDIDKFDYKFFNISPLEAKLMDPSHRIFLQTAYKAIEDAGYIKEKLAGTSTGVFVGHSSSNIYGSYITRTEPQLTSISIPGNMSSILSGRLSYILDLKGPNMLIDTACSSSLVAIYQACKAIRAGDCEQAIAGGIRINLFPVEGAYETGIESKNNKVKTFDDNSDGTIWGEGAAVILLKPLEKALADKDNIYAVIKGVAANQDGTSISMTAPNSLAQKDVILSAWKDADINPETISYIEAHGTGTKLGDPVEITGIQKAFMEYTDKKQFCAIGSIKPNIGHLDNASGITGIIKAVLALRNKVIPPSLNFETPNRAISFEQSPVYVADRKIKWETDGFPRRCGVSSFGFSGTNCHIVLEEAPEIEQSPIETSVPLVLTLSAKSKDALWNLIKSYREFLCKTQLKLKDICYTAATGRNHYEHRLAIKVNSIEAALMKIESLNKTYLDEEYEENGIYYRHTGSKGKLLHEKIDNNNELNLKNIDNLIKEYIMGFDIDWEKLYTNTEVRKVNIPTYSFEENRCWVDWEKSEKEQLNTNGKSLKHPLLDHLLVESINQKIYVTKLTPEKYWVLDEHRIMGSPVVPGTTYLEMIREICALNDMEQAVTLKDVYFIDPLLVNEGQYKDVQVIVQQDKGTIKFTIASKMEDKWIRHVEAYAQPCDNLHGSIDLNKIKNKCKEKGVIDKEKYVTDSAVFGPRWRSLKEVYIGKGEFLSYFELPEEFTEDINEYKLHPALLDCAVNTSNGLLGDGVYLPLAYKTLNIYRAMPSKFYSYIKRTDEEDKKTDSASYDIMLFCENGDVFADIKGYMVKKMSDVNSRFRELAGKAGLYYETKWVSIEEEFTASLQMKERVLIFTNETGIEDNLTLLMKASGAEIIEVSIEDCYKQISNSKYAIGTTGADYVRLLTDLVNRDFRPTRIIHLTNVGKINQANVRNELKAVKDKGVLSLFHLTKALYECEIKDNIQVVLVAESSTEVTGQEQYINPQNAAFLSMGKVIASEFPNLNVRCIDIDENTGTKIILNEILSQDKTPLTAYRNGQRYLEYMKELSIAEKPLEPISVKSDGIYIITGGFGGLGIEVCKYLSQKSKSNICLIGRKQLPPVENWDSIIQKKEDAKLCDRLKAIRQMQAGGANIGYFSADVSNFEQMEDLIGRLRSEFGAIKGIIHAAGVAGDGLLINKSEEKFCNVINPKIDGTLILDILTQNDPVDFFILFSSIVALAGGVGQSDYTAANSFLDAFSFYRNKKGKRTLSINWTGWKETGMAVDYGVDFNGVFKGISTDDAIKTFDEVVNKKVNRAIIAEPNYHNIIFENEANFPLKLSEEMRFAAKKVREKVDKSKGKEAKSWINNVKLKGKPDGSYTKTELKVGQIWGEVLGIDEIDIHEDFIGLGGNSLLALKLEAEMGKENLEIEYADISWYPTISELSKFVDEKQNSNCDGENSIQESIVNLNSNTEVSIKEEKQVNEVIELDKDYIAKEMELLYKTQDFGESKDIMPNENTEYLHLGLPLCIEDEKVHLDRTSHSGEWKELTVVMQKDITVYLHWSLPLCVVLAHDKFLPWFYNKFIQIFSHTNENGFVLLNYLENYNNICEIGKYQGLGVNVLKNIPSIIDFVIENINNGYYLIINLDESLLPNKTAYGSDHFIHESLIYGYDNEIGQIKAIGFNENHMFTKIEFEYDLFVKAYESAKINYRETSMHCEWASIRLVKINESDNEYPFSLQVFTQELKNYLFSIQDKAKTYIYDLEHKGGSYECGFKVYDVYINNLKKMLDGIFTMDYRATHLLAEHKRCIYNRLVFIMSKYDMPTEFKELCGDYAKIADRFEQIRIKAYIQSRQQIESNILSDEHKHAIMEIIDRVDELKNEEKNILLRIYEHLNSIANNIKI